MIFKPGQTIGEGRYRIEAYVAEGGMAEVWRATHLPTGRAMAIKVIRRAHASNDNVIDRFKLEYDLMKRLEHPRIMRVEDFNWHSADGLKLPWFSMDYFPYTLEQRLEQISIGEGLKTILYVLEALELAHAHNICHRDLKPVNIMTDKRGQAALTDFGIAKETDAQRHLTGKAILGTPYYLSPEQCLQVPVTPQSDLYAIGVILYRLCTGRLPFEQSSMAAVVRAHIGETPKPVSKVNANVSKKLSDIIERCLAKKPEERFASARELRERLARCEELNEAEKHILAPGDLVLDGKYEVVNLIEQGGFAEVYRVRERATDSVAALKICLSQLAFAPKMLRRFEQEISILKRLDHPAIVKVLDAGAHQSAGMGLPFFVMPYYPGTLQTSLGGRVDPNKAMRVMLQVFDALDYAHGYSGGVCHRDLKPSNIVIDGQGRAALLDFGIAQIKPELSSELTRSATVTRSVFGSSHYMAPEQIKNEPVDARADIYALGVILYEIATGRRVFDGSSGEQIIAMHLYERPNPPRKVNPRVTPRMQQIILRCLEKAPDKRFGSVKELRSALVKAGGKGGKWFDSLEGDGARGKRRAGLRRFALGAGAGLAMLWLLSGLGAAMVAGAGFSPLDLMPPRNSLRGAWLPAMAYRRAQSDASSRDALVLTRGADRVIAMATPTPQPSATPQPTATLTPQPTATPAPSPSLEPTPTATPPPTPTPQPTPTVTPPPPTPTPQPTPTATPPPPTPTPQPTPTARPTATPQPTPTATPRPTPTPQPTPTATPLPTPTPPPTPTPSPTDTPRPTPSPTPAASPRPTATPIPRPGDPIADYEAAAFAQQVKDVLTQTEARMIASTYVERLCHPTDFRLRTDFATRYNPTTTEGLRLLSGELTFVDVTFDGRTDQTDEFHFTIVLGDRSGAPIGRERYRTRLVRLQLRPVVIADRLIQPRSARADRP